MIIANLTHSERTEGLHPAFRPLFEYIKAQNWAETPLGRIELDGDRLFINNVGSTCIPMEQQVLEMHRDYIDVHVPLDKPEIIGWKSIESMQHLSKEYDKDNDFALSDDCPSTYVTVQPGEFAIVYPEDLHAPIIGEGKIRKLIGKVRISTPEC